MHRCVQGACGWVRVHAWVGVCVCDAQVCAVRDCAAVARARPAGSRARAHSDTRTQKHACTHTHTHARPHPYTECQNPSRAQRRRIFVLLFCFVCAQAQLGVERRNLAILFTAINNFDEAPPPPHPPSLARLLIPPHPGKRSHAHKHTHEHLSTHASARCQGGAAVWVHAPAGTLHTTRRRRDTHALAAPHKVATALVCSRLVLAHAQVDEQLQPDEIIQLMDSFLSRVRAVPRRAAHARRTHVASFLPRARVCAGAPSPRWGLARRVPMGRGGPHGACRCAARVRSIRRSAARRRRALPVTAAARPAGGECPVTQ